MKTKLTLLLLTLLTACATSPKPKKTALVPVGIQEHFNGPEAIGYTRTHLLSTAEGIDIDMLTRNAPAKVKSLPPTPPMPPGMTFILSTAQLRCVTNYYAHKEQWHNQFDVFYCAYSGLLSNHVYRLVFSPCAQQGPTLTQYGASCTNWTGYPEYSLTWVTWGQGPQSLLQFGMPVKDATLEKAFFKLQDVTGQ